MPCRESFRFFLLGLASGASAQTPLHTELAATGLLRPVLVTAPPGDFQRLFVVEQQGRIQIVRNGAVVAPPFLDLVGSGTVSFGGEMGLLGLAFHPNYASNGQFFVYHTTPPFVNAVVRRFLRSTTDPDRADPTSGQIVLSVQLIYGNHNAGMIEFGPDGYLYVAIGDGGSTGPLWPNDPQNHAQRDDTLLGKMLRIDIDNPNAPLLYGIPASNPFAAPGNPRDEIWAFGFRNPWRFTFDRLTGDKYIADVGGMREEVDFEPAADPGGRNYGWSCMSGTQCGNAAACTCNAPTLTLPLHEYTTGASKAIIGGYVYRGAAIPDLRGTYFFADFATSQIWSFVRTGAGVTQFTDRTAELLPPAPYLFWNGITSFGQDGRGEIYLCDIGGQVYRIVPDFPVQTGLQPYGAGAAGCAGAHTLDADTSPVLGNLAFQLECDNAPPSGFGLVVIGQPDVAGTDPFALGFNLHFQLSSPLLVMQVIGSDAAGVGRYPLPIPPAGALAGFVLCAQAGWYWNPAVCTPTPTGWSSTHGLLITLQP